MASAAVDLTASDDEGHDAGYDAELEKLKEEHRRATQQASSLKHEPPQAKYFF